MLAQGLDVTSSEKNFVYATPMMSREHMAFCVLIE
jgi:hypothetical protein